MRIYSSFYLVALLVLGGVFVTPAQSVAQDIFLKKERGSGSDGSGNKLYLTPKPGALNTTRYRSGNQERTLYNNTGREQQSRMTPRTSRPDALVNRNNELDRIQRANIEGARAAAARNAEIVKQMQKTWDAERAAADEEALEQYRAEQAGQGNTSNTASGSGSGKDLSNAKYLGEKGGKGMKTPTRTFNVFQ